MSLHQSSRSSVSIFQSNRCSTRNALLAATALTIVSGGAAWANDGDANDLLLKKMEKMERRIQSFEAELKQKQTSSPAAGAKPAPVSVPAPPKSANTEIPPGKPADASNTLGSALATLPTPGDEDVPLLHEFGERRVTAQTWMVLPKNAHVSARKKLLPANPWNEQWKFSDRKIDLARFQREMEVLQVNLRSS